MMPLDLTASQSGQARPGARLREQLRRLWEFVRSNEFSGLDDATF